MKILNFVLLIWKERNSGRYEHARACRERARAPRAPKKSTSPLRIFSTRVYIPQTMASSNAVPTTSCVVEDRVLVIWGRNPGIAVARGRCQAPSHTR